MQLRLLNAATAQNGAPSGATAGFSLWKGATAGRPDDGFALDNLDDCVLLAQSTAGSGTMTVTMRLWGYSSVTAQWHPLGTHTTDSSRGIVNEATAVGEIDTNLIQFAQVIAGLRHFERVYLEITAIGGTGTAITAYLVARN